MITLAELKRKLTRAVDAFARAKDSVEIPALKTLEGAMKKRIHNDRKDSNGLKIGVKGPRGVNYTEGYRKEKAKRTGSASGNAIDLFLDGNLQRGVTVGKSGKKNVLGFRDDLSRKKAEKHTNNYNTKIYKPSKDELTKFKKAYRKTLFKELQKAFS